MCFPGESLSLPFSVTGKNKSKVSVYLSERYVVADEDKSVATIKKESTIRQAMTLWLMTERGTRHISIYM